MQPVPDRNNPSQRYIDLIVQYRLMHQREDMFLGGNLIRHAGNINTLIQQFGTKTLLDYGSGKGIVYDDLNLKERWGLDEIHLYDPGFPVFDTLPPGPVDAVICLDVLEHCPEDDLDWILTEIVTYAEQFVYLNIATRPAIKTLPNGENAHCTVQPSEWWQAKIEAIFEKLESNMPCYLTVDV